MTQAQRLLFVCLFAGILGCDSAVNSPELSIKFVQPSQGQALVPGEPFRLQLSIVSALDIRDADIMFGPSADAESAFLAKGIRIDQGASLRRFRIDTTLTLPLVDDGVEKGRLFLITPAGTQNRVASMGVELK